MAGDCYGRAVDLLVSYEPGVTVRTSPPATVSLRACLEVFLSRCNYFGFPTILRFVVSGSTGDKKRVTLLLAREKTKQFNCSLE